MNNKVLEVKNLHFNYGEINAIKGISFEVYAGEVVTLLGANGAGKTTTLQSISGLIKGISKGEIYFMGERINGLRPHVIAGKGLSHCLEGRLIFPQLSVMENLLMGDYLYKDRAVINQELEYVFGLFPRLFERKTQNGGTLSGGEQQMLAVGRALMQRPKLLMMDEPSLGLAPLIIDEIFRAIKKINSDGIPILLVEQNSTVALSITNRGYVMETGEIKYTDTAENLLGNDEIKKAYLGVK
jgi:branched-chain amino acid transport system ATP-binding protein